MIKNGQLELLRRCLCFALIRAPELLFVPFVHVFCSSIGLAKAALESINGENMFGAQGASWSVIYVDIDAHNRNRTIFDTILPRESNSKVAEAWFGYSDWICSFSRCCVCSCCDDLTNSLFSLIRETAAKLKETVCSSLSECYIIKIYIVPLGDKFIRGDPDLTELNYDRTEWFKVLSDKRERESKASCRQLIQTILG